MSIIMSQMQRNGSLAMSHSIKKEGMHAWKICMLIVLTLFLQNERFSNFSEYYQCQIVGSRRGSRSGPTKRSNFLSGLILANVIK